MKFYKLLFHKFYIAFHLIWKKDDMKDWKAVAFLTSWMFMYLMGVFAGLVQLGLLIRNSDLMNYSFYACSILIAVFNYFIFLKGDKYEIINKHFYHNRLINKRIDNLLFYLFFAAPFITMFVTFYLKTQGYF